MASLLSGLDVHGACEKKVMELKHQFIAAASVLPTCRIVANKQQMPQQNYQSAANRVQTQNLDPTPPRQPSTPFNNTTANGAALQVWPVQNGLFSLRGNIEFAHRMVIRAMQECNATIKHSDPTSITGKMPLGINLFGITIKAFFYANGDTVTLRFSATFTDAVDIWGSGDKKIQLISNRLIELCKADPTVELLYQSNPQR